MRFRDDTRGVTVQIGAVLFFAIVIIALSLYQATVVPSQNADVEYRHSQTVQGQLVEVRNGILQTAATGNVQTASVTLGTQYPSRVFLMNPPPATGTLRTGQYENNTLRVSNVEANDSETDDYIDGTWSAPTKYLTYSPNYNEYDGAPNRVYEASFLYNHYDEANVPLTDQLLVQGNTITLVALNGSMSTSQSGTVSVSASPASAPYRSVQVRPQDPGEPMNITVPTRLSAETIRNTTSLGEKPGVTVTDGGPTSVVISLTANQTFILQTARVDVGSQPTELDAHYLTVVDRDDDEVTVEARDRFNNPVSGVTVSVNGSNPFKSTNAVTNVDGRATFEFADGATGQGTLEILGGGQTHERVTVSAPTTGPGGGGQLVSLGNATAFDGQDSGSRTGGFNFTVRNDFASSVTITDVSVVPENDDINGLSDVAPGEGPGRSELNVEALTSGANAVIDVPLTTNEYTYVGPRGLTLSAEQSREERVYDTSSGAFTTASTSFTGPAVELAPGGKAAITVAEFYALSGSSATAVNVSNEDFRVVVSYRKNGAEGSSEFVVYARPPGATGGGGSGGSPPSITTFQTTDTSKTSGNPKYARFDVDWAVSDESAVRTVELTMTRVSSGQQVDSETISVSGSSASGTTTLRGPNQSSNPNGQQYEITITVTDDDGQTTTRTRTVTVG